MQRKSVILAHLINVEQPNNDLVEIHVFHDPITLLCDLTQVDPKTGTE